MVRTAFAISQGRRFNILLAIAISTKISQPQQRKILYTVTCDEKWVKKKYGITKKTKVRRCWIRAGIKYFAKI